MLKPSSTAWSNWPEYILMASVHTLFPSPFHRPEEKREDITCHIAEGTFDIVTPNIDSVLHMSFLQSKNIVDWGEGGGGEGQPVDILSG